MKAPRCHLVVLMCLMAVMPGFALGADWTVTIQVHEAISLTDDDAAGADDMYWSVNVGPTKGGGAKAHCDAADDHDDDNNHITPGDWICTATITGGPDVLAQIVLTLMEHDTTSADEEFDINPSPGQLGLLMYFTPATSQLGIAGLPGHEAHCAYGRIRTRGWDGDDQAEIVFSVSASDVGAPDGDSDGDGLLDSWEVCGVDGDKNDTPELNLAAMGANRYRKDIFVEIDWMRQPTAMGATPAHTHAPWLPSLITAWNELNVAPVSSPTPTGGSNGGIALHVDTGILYDNGYSVDYNGDGTPEIVVPMGGNWDVNADGMPDIGALGALGPPGPLNNTTGGGNELPEDALLDPVGGDNFAPGSDFANIKATNFYAPRDWIFHYVIFGHQHDAAGSSGRAECVTKACNDFMVTLGAFFNPPMLPRQTVDSDGDGWPNPGAAVINGPTGLPVDGTFADHTGTFLHELGHNMGLDHGGPGPDAINYKPNYLSIMNYSWQVRGIGFDFGVDNGFDQVGVSFDGDGVNDAQRFLYSGDTLTPGPLAPLNENGGLNENVPVAAAGTTAIVEWSCPPVMPPPPMGPNPPYFPSRADRPIDWNCNMVPGETNVTADINNQFFSSGVLETLNGAVDYPTINTTGLNFNRGITAQEKIDQLSRRQRIYEPGREFHARCKKPRRIDFENLASGKRVTNQYGPTVIFLNDAERAPQIVDGPGRNNVPTQSPNRSLLNRSRAGTPTSLVIDFQPAQRALSLFFGQAGLTSSQREGIRAVLQATDQNGLPMGRILKDLPPTGGVTHFLAAAASWPDESISRIELSYETNAGIALEEPVLIDDLTVCPILVSKDKAPPLAKPPIFGTRLARLSIRSENIHAQPAPDGDPDHFAYVRMPFTGLPVNVSGAIGTTGFDLTKAEGSKLTVAAPAVHGGRKFLYWKHSSGANFGTSNSTIPFTLLNDGVLTAVYEGRGKQQGHPPPGGGGHRGPCDCVPCCERKHGH